MTGNQFTMQGGDLPIMGVTDYQPLDFKSCGQPGHIQSLLELSAKLLLQQAGMDDELYRHGFPYYQAFRQPGARFGVCKAACIRQQPPKPGALSDVQRQQIP
ncbi:MAG: hypothetical protein WD623_10000 [Marinobacter sp.]|uniref:hypothetical protein n=1 Tax=Marinobacter sp. TaxID=50741 RepID=UPI00349FE793